MNTLYRDFIKETAAKALGGDDARLRQVLSKLPPVQWPRPAVLPLNPRRTDNAAFDENRSRFRGLLWQAQECVCPWCKKKMRLGLSSLDHVQPLSTGGRNWLGNLLLMHKECNTKKGDTPPSRELLEALERVNHWIFIREGRRIFVSEPVKVMRR